jgi:hypothetical protein
METKKNVPSASAVTPGSPTADMEESKFNNYVDTLRQLLPAPTYSWDAKESFVEGQYVTDIGIAQRMTDFTRNFTDTHESNVALEQLCSVLREFPQEGRLKPLEAFIELYTEQSAAHKEKLDKVEADFQENLMTKASGKYESLIVIASAISTMAFLAIFLVLLSVQRNIKMLGSR